MQEEWKVQLSVWECVNPVIEKWLWNAYLQQFMSDLMWEETYRYIACEHFSFCLLYECHEKCCVDELLGVSIDSNYCNIDILFIVYVRFFLNDLLSIILQEMMHRFSCKTVYDSHKQMSPPPKCIFQNRAVVLLIISKQHRWILWNLERHCHCSKSWWTNLLANGKMTTTCVLFIFGMCTIEAFLFFFFHFYSSASQTTNFFFGEYMMSFAWMIGHVVFVYL